jgi:Rrf2 family protein
VLLLAGVSRHPHRGGHTREVEITARADYTLRALAQLAVAGGGPLTVHQIAEGQGIPAGFLQNILLQLRRRGIVRSQRGADGGYRLARPANEITLAEAFRAVEGPLAGVRGERPETLDYHGPVAPLADVWVALRVSLRDIMERTTVADVAFGPLPDHVVAATAVPGARETR